MIGVRPAMTSQIILSSRLDHVVATLWAAICIRRIHSTMGAIMVTSFDLQSRLKSFSEGGLSMKQTILGKHVLRLSAPLLSLLLLILLAVGSVSAGSPSKQSEMDRTTAMVIRHMNKMKQNFPEIEARAQQTETELTRGMMSPRKACSNCHVDEAGKP